MTKVKSTGADQRKIHWERLERATVHGIVWQGVVTFAVIAFGLTSFPLFLIAFMLEILVVSALTGLLYPGRGMRRVSDAFKSIFIMLFLCIFLVPMYLATQESESPLLDPAAVLGIGTVPVAVAVSVMGVRLAVLWQRAKRMPDQRVAWARYAVQSASVNVITMFLGVFTAMIALVLAPLLTTLGLPNAGDIAFGLVFVVTNSILAAIMGTMTEEELKEIVANPYID